MKSWCPAAYPRGLIGGERVDNRTCGWERVGRWG